MAGSPRGSRIVLATRQPGWPGPGRKGQGMKRTTIMVAMLVVALSGTALAARLSGTAGDDLIRGTSGDDVLQGLAGDDALYGIIGGNNFLYGQLVDVAPEGLGDPDACQPRPLPLVVMLFVPAIDLECARGARRHAGLPFPPFVPRLAPPKSTAPRGGSTGGKGGWITTVRRPRPPRCSARRRRSFRSRPLCGSPRPGSCDPGGPGRRPP